MATIYKIFFAYLLFGFYYGNSFFLKSFALKRKFILYEKRVSENDKKKYTEFAEFLGHNQTILNNIHEFEKFYKKINKDR